MLTLASAFALRMCLTRLASLSRRAMARGCSRTGFESLAAWPSVNLSARTSRMSRSSARPLASRFQPALSTSTTTASFCIEPMEMTLSACTVLVLNSTMVARVEPAPAS
jgi:hypothetical protein